HFHMARQSMHPRIRAALAGLIAASVLAAAPRAASAQNVGTLTGTITDSSGAVVPGATITVTEVAAGAALVAISDGDGRYVVADLPAGRYELSVTLDGFKSIARSNLIVDPNRALHVDAVLEIAGVTEAVTVSVGAVQIDAASMAIAQTMSSAR